jgi:DNA-binding CsgD family transcriptional regulator/PAS domain-containing protein
MDNNSQKLEEIRQYLRKYEGYDKDLTTYKDSLFPLENIRQIPIFANQFFYVIDVPRAEIAYMHPQVKAVLGYEAEEVNLKFLYELVHPDDLAIVLEAIDAIYRFCMQNYVPPLNDNFQLDYRLKTSSGNYIRIFRQSMVLAIDRNDKMIHNLSLCSNIDNLKQDTRIEVTGIGENMKAFNDIFDTKKYYPKQAEELSERELEILQQIMLGKSSESIGNQLFISKNTVDVHRRNILQKTKTKNTVELIAYAYKKQLLE